ncbi:hypothetical protein CASFOL_026141 [Castilleja foliolosa]|uniref:Retrotransposon Copia-like N-terminal domain-containing protein n=1 Tax=Castilleja foliolosa TaxID=1961234 RepID=A0ABD3CUJ1_9LAMI
MAPTTKSPIDDITTPYYIHPSDAINLMLVSHPLTEDNYASWSRAMVMALTVKNKLGFVDGSIATPGADDPILLSAWIRNQNMVMSWILNAVSKDIQSSIMYSSTAKDVWAELKTRYSQSNGPRVFQLRRELANLHQGQLSVNAYYTKIKAIWDELENFRSVCACGKCECGGVTRMIAEHAQDLVISFLMGLNDDLQATRGQILLMDPPPSINKVFSLVTQEERQRSVAFTSPTSIFAVKNTGYSSESNKKSQGATTGFNSQYKKRDRPYCTHCNMQGHTVERCYRIHGFPPHSKMEISETDEQQEPMKKADAESKAKVKKKSLAVTSKQEKTPAIRATLPYLKTRNSPDILVKAVKKMTDAQLDDVRDMGFESLLSLEVTKIPSKLSHWLLDSFDPMTREIRLQQGRQLRVEACDVSMVLGFPNGTISMQNRMNGTSSDFVKEFRRLFVNAPMLITAKKVSEKMLEHKRGGIWFKRLFLILMTTCLIESRGNGYVTNAIVDCFMDINNVQELAWGDYVIHCLVKKTEEWQRNKDNPYTGPILFLLGLYVDRVVVKERTVPRSYPSLKNWTYKLLREREQLELKSRGFGSGFPEGRLKKTGSNKVRKVDMPEGVSIVRSEKAKDELVLDGNDIEQVRKVDMHEGVSIVRSEKVKDELVLDGNDIEQVRKVNMPEGVSIVRSEKAKDELVLDGNDIEQHTLAFSSHQPKITAPTKIHFIHHTSNEKHSPRPPLQILIWQSRDQRITK